MNHLNKSIPYPGSANNWTMACSAQLGPMDYPRSYHAVVAGSLEQFCTQE